MDTAALFSAAIREIARDTRRAYRPEMSSALPGSQLWMNHVATVLAEAVANGLIDSVRADRLWHGAVQVRNGRI